MSIFCCLLMPSSFIVDDLTFWRFLCLWWCFPLPNCWSNTRILWRPTLEIHAGSEFVLLLHIDCRWNLIKSHHRMSHRNSLRWGQENGFEECPCRCLGQSATLAQRRSPRLLRLMWSFLLLNTWLPVRLPRSLVLQVKRRLMELLKVPNLWIHPLDLPTSVEQFSISIFKQLFRKLVP